MQLGERKEMTDSAVQVLKPSITDPAVERRVERDQFGPRLVNVP